MRVEIYDPRFEQLVGKQFTFETLFDQAIWAEGPAWFKDQQALIFSDVKGNTMYRWSAQTGTQVFRQPSHFANGNAVALNGDLISCEHGSRGISLTNFTTGERQLLVDKIAGKTLNSPNDVVVKSDGTIWFTDPPYGILSDAEGKKSPSEVIGCYVYCFDPKTEQLNIATFNVMRPKGLAFSADEKTLFVADMSSIEFGDEGFHHLVKFDVDGKTLKNRQEIAEINPGIPDGFCVDSNGVIYCSCETGIIVLLSDGTLLGRFVWDKVTSNCTFGNSEKEIFITSSNSLYRLTLA